MGESFLFYKKKTLSDGIKKEIVELYEEGYSMKALSDIFHVDNYKIAKVIDEFGVRRPESVQYKKPAVEVTRVMKPKKSVVYEGKQLYDYTDIFQHCWANDIPTPNEPNPNYRRR